jgi:PRC-barrel domain
MLRSIKEMLDYSILATDGEIGHVSDILLGDSDLKVRYLVIDTGGWLSGRKVLLSTAWLSGVAPEKQLIVVNIDKKRIEESPPYDPNVEIPREYETQLHDHYGYPYYWQP